MYKRLPESFFARNTVEVAKELLGTLLVHQITPRQTIVARIVETEAYCEDDPACHAFGNFQRKQAGKPVTGRSALLFGPPGVAYVYLNYGIHWLFNVVTEKEGKAGAVLVRAVEPIVGLEVMKKKRPRIQKLQDLTNGPGKVTLAMAIGAEHNGLNLAKGPLYLACAAEPAPLKIAVSPRIGISKGTELPWRFYAAENQFVSQHRFQGVMVPS